MTYEQAQTTLTCPPVPCVPGVEIMAVPASDEAIDMVLDPDCRNVEYLILSATALEAWPVVSRDV